MDFEESVAALTAKEAAKIELALNDLEEKLYMPLTENETVPVVESEHDVYKEYMQSAMVGYSAHKEDVSNEEVIMWQNNFKYLEIKGSALLELDSEYEDEMMNSEGDQFEGVSFVPTIPCNQNCDDEISNAPSIGDDITNLRISGVSVPINQSNRSINNSEVEDELMQEEVLYSNGVVEETLCVNIEPIHTISSTENEHDETLYDSLDPKHCQQSEVINSLVDVIFPDMAKLALRRLVSRVVKTGRDCNVAYVANSQNNNAEYDESGVCGYYSDQEKDNDCVIFSSDENCYDSSNANGYDAGCQHLVIPEGWD